MIQAVQVSEGRSPRISALAVPVAPMGVFVETGEENPETTAGVMVRMAIPTLGAFAVTLTSMVAVHAQPRTQPRPPQVLS